MSLVEIADALANLPVSGWLAGISWLVPTVQSIHIFAIAIVFTSVLVMSGRVSGLFAVTEAAGATTRRFLPWIHGSLVVLLLSGSVLVLIEPQRQLLNAYFQIKMIMLALFLLVLVVGIRVARAEDRESVSGGARVLQARGAGLFSVGLLLAIIWSGRWIAYTQ